MQTTAEKKSTQQALDWIDRILGLELDVASLGPDEQFADADIYARRLQHLASIIKSIALDEISYPLVNELFSTARSAFGSLEAATVYPKGSLTNPGDLQNTLQQDYSQFSRVTVQIVASSAVFNPGALSLANVLAEATETQTRCKSIQETLQRELNAALKKVEDYYGRAVIAKHAGNFESEAKHQSDLSWRWFAAGNILVIFLFLYAFWFMKYELQSLFPLIGPQIPWTTGLQLTLPNFIGVSLITYLLVLCMKNFLACRHNCAVNRHRALALSSFESFVAASDDKQAKEALLLEAAKAIFEPQTSGYLKAESEPAHSSQIIEVFRGLSGNR